MSDIEKKLTGWITGELHKPRGDKGVKKIEIRTAPPGGKGIAVDSIELDRRYEVDEIGQMAQDLIARAQDDADGSGPHVQRYIVQVYVTGESKPQGRFPFRLRGDTDMDFDEGSGEESPTNKGLLTQLMRHNEALTRGIATSTAAMMSIMTRRAESDATLAQKLLEERTQMFESLEEAKSRNHEREMEALVVVKESDRKDKAFEKLLGYVPVVLNRIAGGKLLPAPNSKDPLVMLLGPLVESLTQEQLQAIGSQLTPDQMIQFVELLQTFQKMKANGVSKEN